MATPAVPGTFPTPFSAPFGANPDFDFEARCVVGHSSFGGSEVGEVLAALSDVAAGDHEGWYAAWYALATRVAAEGAEARQGGHRVTARPGCCAPRTTSARP